MVPGVGTSRGSLQLVISNRVVHKKAKPVQRLAFYNCSSDHYLSNSFQFRSFHGGDEEKVRDLGLICIQ